MIRYCAALVGLAALGLFSLGCGKQVEKQPTVDGAPPQAQSPEQTTSPNAPPPPAGRSGDADSGMNVSPTAPAENPSESTPAADSQTASSDEADGEVRPGRVAGALFRAIRSSVPIPGNLGGTGNAAPQNAEEAPRFQP
ncbi:hypothetical protein [Thermopirellula anaerolimosa]